MPLNQISCHFEERRQEKLEIEKVERALRRAKKALMKGEILIKEEALKSHRGIEGNMHEI